MRQCWALGLQERSNCPLGGGASHRHFPIIGIIAQDDASVEAAAPATYGDAERRLRDASARLRESNIQARHRASSATPPGLIDGAPTIH